MLMMLDVMVGGRGVTRCQQGLPEDGALTGLVVMACRLGSSDGNKGYMNSRRRLLV